jgi:hypothetical protein
MIMFGGLLVSAALASRDEPPGFPPASCVALPSELRVPCGHPPYTPADGCTAALGCCYNPMTVPGDWCYPMVNSSSCADKCHTPPPSCPSPSPPANKDRTGCDLRQLRTMNYSACEAACCGEPRCTSMLAMGGKVILTPLCTCY